MLEKEIEKYFKQQVEATGALCFKFTSPGTRGVPDRIVFTKWEVFLVELKRPKGGRFSAHQLRWQRLFKELGYEVHHIKSKEEVDHFVESHLT